MRRRILSLSLLATCLATGLARPSAAGPVLDQSHFVPAPASLYAIVSTQSLAQTFTAGLAGQLAEVDMQLAKSAGATGDLTFTIRTTTNGLPNPDDGQSLYTQTIALSSLPTNDDPFTQVPLTAFDVSSAHINVTPGEVLALALSRTGPGTPPWATWQSSSDLGSNAYSRGAQYQRSSSSSDWTLLTVGTVGQDAGFQTFVSSVPEPSTFALGSIGAAGLAGYGWRKRRRAIA